MNGSTDNSEGHPTQRSNEEVAMVLEEVAELLEAQGANPYRVRAYRTAAGTVRTLTEPLHRIVQEQDVASLIELPGIGRSLAHSIDHFVRSGRLPLLERLRGENAPERIFATVADIGPKLAHAIHEELGIETLTELEAAARDGRLANVPGMGPKRLRAVRESLAGRFRQPAEPKQIPQRPSATETEQVPIEELLNVDEQYRRLARQGRLPRIAPRRFNPTREAWLPVLHTVRDDRHYTALYSNTARAHEMGAIHDWVIIYRDDDDHHGRWTVITANYGRLRGRRIVRGREEECLKYYADLENRPLLND
jgi:DNA uptake protein ComE-like DNA-binding protein